MQEPKKPSCIRELASSAALAKHHHQLIWQFSQLQLA